MNPIGDRQTSKRISATETRLVIVTGNTFHGSTCEILKRKELDVVLEDKNVQLLIENTHSRSNMFNERSLSHNGRALENNRGSNPMKSQFHKRLTGSMLATLVACTAFLGMSAVSLAGTMQPRLCSTSGSSEGFSASSSLGGGTSDHCSTGGYLTGSAGSTQDSTGTWTLSAPTGTTITGYYVGHAYSFTPDSGVWGRGIAWIVPSGGVGNWHTGCTEFSCASGYSSGWTSRSVGAGTFSAASLAFYAHCWGAPCAADASSGYTAIYSISDIRPYINDPYDPTRSSSLAGDLYENETTVSGTEDIAWTAADTGTGVYTASLLVDGSVSDTWTPDTNSGKCVEHSGFFYYVQPCRSSVLVERTLDTTSLSEGTHTFAVRTTDASGNTYTSGTWTRTVDNIAAPTAPSSGSGGAISGSVQPGEDVTCTHGTFTGTGLTYTYQWYRDAVSDANAITGSTSATRTVSSADISHTLICRITATNSEGSTHEDLETGVVGATGTENSRDPVQTTTTSPSSSSSNTSNTSSIIADTSANGSGADREATISGFFKDGSNSKSTEKYIKYGKKLTMSGRLLNKDGGAITNARISIRGAVYYGGASRRFGDVGAVGTTTTDDKGYWSYNVSPGPSRKLTASYRAYAADTKFADETDLMVHVFGAAKIKAPKTVRRGKAVWIKGKLLGSYCPSGAGVQLQPAWLTGGKYASFGDTRYNRRTKSCTIKQRVLFKKKKGVPTMVITMRLTLPDGAGVWPFEKSTSNSVKIRVKGS